MIKISLVKIIYKVINVDIVYKYQFQMYKILIGLTLLLLSNQQIFPNFPDAIRCGADHSCCDGAIFIIHLVRENKESWYCQVYSPENRCVTFDVNGNYASGWGDYDSRKGCQNKSIATLQKQGRNYNFYAPASNSTKSESNNTEQKIAALQQRIAILQKKQLFANFWDYEQIKQKWMNQFLKNVLGHIKKYGVQIQRWRIQPQASLLTIRDMHANDSRYAFAAGKYIDL